MEYKGDLCYFPWFNCVTECVERGRVRQKETTRESVCVCSIASVASCWLFKMDHLKSDSHLVWVLRLSARGACRRLGQFSPMRVEPLSRAKGEGRRGHCAYMANILLLYPESSHRPGIRHLVHIWYQTLTSDCSLVCVCLGIKLTAMLRKLLLISACSL